MGSKCIAIWVRASWNRLTKHASHGNWSSTNLTVERQKSLPVVYKGQSLDVGYRVDLIVEGKLLIELKTVNKIEPVHKAQLLTYLKLTGLCVGLLMNFNAATLREGIQRMVH